MSTGSHDYVNVRRVAIVGAGVAGLQAADELAKVGIKEVVVFEGSDRVGGVWRDNYAGYNLQVPHELYEFPSFSPSSSDETWPEFPSGEQVQCYIERFAEARDLKQLVRFKTRIVKMSPTASNK
jgi:dimethylaniline monooxygenase (N-oxide forming)